MKNRKRLTYEDFKRYFSNHLPNKEKHDFEKRMMQDAFEEEAYEGLSNLSAEEQAGDINTLRNGIRQRTIRKRRLVPVWFRYAASVLLLLGIGVSVYLINDLPDQEERFIGETVQKPAREQNPEKTQPKSDQKKETDYFIAPTGNEESPPSQSVSTSANETPPQPQNQKEQNEPVSKTQRSKTPPKQEKSSILENDALEFSDEIAIADEEIAQHTPKSEELPTETSQNQVKAQLKGEVAGIDINRNKEKPAQKEKLAIRGYSAQTDSLQPLIVVDGIPQPGPLSHLKAENIETLAVYKGGTATALFGSSGQNGVILISTKVSMKDTNETDRQAAHKSARTEKSSPEVITFKNTNFRVINGKVLSSRDGSRVHRAAVYFKKMPALRTSTNRMGNFTLIGPLSEDYQQLRVTHASYKSQDVRIKDTADLIISLDPLKVGEGNR